MVAGGNRIQTTRTCVCIKKPGTGPHSGSLGPPGQWKSCGEYRGLPAVFPHSSPDGTLQMTRGHLRAREPRLWGAGNSVSVLVFPVRLHNCCLRNPRSFGRRGEAGICLKKSGANRNPRLVPFCWRDEQSASAVPQASVGAGGRWGTRVAVPVKAVGGVLRMIGLTLFF